MALSANEWAAQIAKQVGRRIAHYRARVPGPKGKRGITAQALAERCTELGLPLDRAVIAKLEKGLRQTITVGEVMVFARALNVPPILLLFPLGQDEEVELLPDVTASTWEAVCWFTGEDRFPAPLVPMGEVDPATGLPEWYEDPAAGWQDMAAPARLYRQHSRLIREWRAARAKIENIVATGPELMEFRSEEDPAGVDAQMIRFTEQAMRRTEEAIGSLRQDMRSQGIKPPRLPADVAFIDPPKSEEAGDKS